MAAVGAETDGMHILHVVGARPNFMKVAPVLHALGKRAGVRQTLVHTGQHYDANMSDVFFEQLGIPAPDVNLGVGAGSHARQTAEIMSRFEPVVLEYKPDLVLVYGDVNSTVAAALVCAKLLIRVGHVEAGLRSFDRTMPEEINRLVTDQLADLLFTHSEDADVNLHREGVAAEKIHLVGNVMIDSLHQFLPLAKQSPIVDQLGLTKNGKIVPFAVLTLHRPSNVDSLEVLGGLLRAIHAVADQVIVIFPVHPRTRLKLDQLKTGTHPRLRVIDPLGYLEFLSLMSCAQLVLTDSGGIQEETTGLGVPCLTLRENTERPITVAVGTNNLVGQNANVIESTAREILSGRGKQGRQPDLWDGQTANRIVDILLRELS